MRSDAQIPQRIQTGKHDPCQAQNGEYSSYRAPTGKQSSCRTQSGVQSSHRVRNGEYIRIEVDAGFLILAAGAVLLAGLDTVLSILSAILVHECAHAFATSICGGYVEKIRFEITGLNMITRFERAVSYGAEIFCAAAGPLANLALGIVLAFSARGSQLLYTVSGANIILGVFNLIPAGRFDGGSILKSVCEKLFPPRAAYYFTRTVSIICGVFVAAGGAVLFWKSGRNITLLICGIFLSYRLFCDTINRNKPHGTKSVSAGLLQSVLKCMRL
jgi:stage IV sporulation protein FB